MCSSDLDQNQTPEPFSTLPHHMTLPYPQGLGVGQGQQAVEMLLNIHDGEGGLLFRKCFVYY